MGVYQDEIVAAAQMHGMKSTNQIKVQLLMN
jgi:hypothetical protein